MHTGIEVHTLGRLQILRDSEPIVGLSTCKAEALLVYLIKTRRPQQIERLANFLGVYSTHSQAVKNLRVVLSNLQQVLGNHLIINRVTASIQRTDQPGNAHATRLLELDPLNESVYRLMMRLVLTSGQRRVALNQYKSFQKLLRGEHSKVSEPETIHPYGQIRMGKIALLPDVAAR